MSKPTAFPLDESRLPFEIPRDEPYREKIARLGQMITDRIPAKKGILTKDDPEYWGLASIVTDEMADVALKMKVRKPMTLPELVKATGKPAGELEPLLQQMAVVGLLEYNWENPRREKQYILPMFVPGSAEFFNMNKQQIADHPEVTAFFERMTFLPLEHITAMVPPGGASIGMHTHHGNCEIIFVLEGSGKMLYDGGEERLNAGDCHYCPENHTHSFVNDGDCDLVFYAVVPKQ